MTTAEFLQGELERLFELESMMALSTDLLGVDPTDVGGTNAKGTYARALVAHCATREGLGALADAIRFTNKDVETLEHVLPEGGDEELAPGMHVGGFRILKRVAQGPLGVVYLAERPGPESGQNERAALKVFRSDRTRNRGASWRLLTAARALKKVRDPGLANVYEAGTLPDGRVFVASEYVAGQTMGARVGRTGAIHFNEIRSVARSLLKGLATLHGRGLLHGHLKADNVFLVRPPAVEGEERPPTHGVLGDLATGLLLGGGEELPGVLRIAGDPTTLAPEVARGEKSDVRSEIYSAGCLLYQALTGKPPFAAASAIEQIAAHLYKEPAAPSENAPRNWVPPELDQAILRALRKDPNERWASAREFADALDGVARSLFPAAAAPELVLEDLQAAVELFKEDRNDEARAAQLEALVAPSKSWQHVVDAFLEGADAAEGEQKKRLLFRTARILQDEMKDNAGAERVYRVVLDFDAEDAQAQNAIEELHRESGDHEGLVGLLLDRLEKETANDARASILREVASLYEEHLDQGENALVAWTQALAEDPEDDRTVRAIERLARTPEQWGEVTSSLNETIEAGERPRAALSLCVIAARFCSRKLNRPDIALPYLSRALAIDPAHEPALDAMTGLLREAQSHTELVQLLLHRADAAPNPGRARELRADAAAVVHSKLGDTVRAEQMFAQIFADDPTHPGAMKALSQIYTGEQNWPKLGDLLEHKAKEQRGKERLETLCELAELYEDRLNDLKRARETFQSVLALDEKWLPALKGLERVYAHDGDYEELLKNLDKQLAAATTPGQRLTLLERTGALLDEHVRDAAQAAERYERIIEVTPAHDAANVALARLYRELHRFDDLAQTLDRHAKSVEDPTRKVELLMQAARVLMADVGSPERAASVCERVLSLVPDHTEALTLISRIRALAGDQSAALDALEVLADAEQDAQKKAELWLRAGQLLEQHDDLDGALTRYKKSLDATASHEPALAALARLYARRGDVRGEAELLLRKVELAQDPTVRAQRLVELGTLRLEKLKDKSLAADAFSRAREIDANNLQALLGLGQLALERGKWDEATQYLEPLLERSTELPPDIAAKVCIGAGDAYRALGAEPKAERAYLNAKVFAPDERIVIERLIDVAQARANHEEASTLVNELLDRFAAELTPSERGLFLIKLGSAQKALGKLPEAAAALGTASELLPENRNAQDALCDVYEAQSNWEALARALRKRFDLVQDEDERFTLWVKSGDLYASKLKDRDKAAKAYVAALEIRADDRNLLTKLMGVYSEGKDWQRLVDVLVRMASVVEESTLRAKYVNTAAAIAHQQLGTLEQAAELYERALSLDGTLELAQQGLADCLAKLAQWERLARLSHSHIERVKDTQKPEQVAALWDALGDIYFDKLKSVDDAVAAYEAAHALDGENRARIEKLVDIYGKNASKYADRAVSAHALLLEHNPYRIESFKALRKLYTAQKRPDEAWCVCQALRSLNMAEPDEEAFFKRHRVQAPAHARECVTEEFWSSYVIHPQQDPLLTAIFATIQPAAIQELAQTPNSFGITRDGAVNCQSDQSVMAQMLFYASGVTLVPLPLVFTRPRDAGGVSFLFTNPPALGLGQAAYVNAPDQALAFIAARQLSYFRAGHYMRQLVPTGSGLRSWLLAAIRLANARFPVPESMVEQVDKNVAALSRTLNNPQQQGLSSLVEQLLKAEAELDMKRWALAVDLTADRIGFALSNSLDAAVAVMRASPEGTSYASERDRLKEMYQYAVSPHYLALRQALGVTIG
jgi:tetratricopeptide (TPR) repeat protein